jgi:hypothetical protein
MQRNEKERDSATKSTRLYALAREWGDVAKEELELARSLQARAAEQHKLADELDRQGRAAEATEARRTVAKWLELADDLLARAEAALLTEGRLEHREDLTTVPAEAKVRQFMPELLLACWHIAHAIEGATTLDTAMRNAALDLYEGLLPDLASFRHHATSVLLERLKRFLLMARDLPAEPVTATWERFRHVLTGFIE